MILVNGQVRDAVPVTDRGLWYGDGVFRTIPLDAGRPLCWVRHFAKLRSDCGVLGIPCPDEIILREELAVVARSEPSGIAKIIVTRGSGARGYRPPRSAMPTRIVMALERTQYPAEFTSGGIKVRRCSTQLALQPLLAGVKHLNRLENVMARAEWSEPSIAEGLLLDQEGNVIEGTMSNLFIVENGILSTPDLRRCGVAGVTRDRIIEAAQQHGIGCKIENIRYDRLYGSQEFWLVNSLIGLWQVREFEGRIWAPGALGLQMRRWLDEESD